MIEMVTLLCDASRSSSIPRMLHLFTWSKMQGWDEGEMNEIPGE